MSVALVHDYVTQRGGAERVVLSMTKAFPDATLYTSLYDPVATYPELGRADIRPSALNRVGVLRRNHRLAFPFLAPMFSAQKIDADIVLCSSSGWSHGVRTTGRKVVYCYSPARWLYQGDRYLGGRHPARRTALAALRPALVRWDRRNARTASRYLTLSTVVQDRILEAYGIEAEVLPPPHTMDVHAPVRELPGIAPGYFLCIARLLAYKNVAAVVTAFDTLVSERLVVVGTGPEHASLKKLAGRNVSLVGAVDDAELRWLYRSCTAVVSASHEDYGLTPIEAAVFGKPAAVLRGGGFLDTVVEGKTGVFFDRPTPAQIANALRRVVAEAWSPELLKAHAARFDEGEFIRRLREVVARA